MRDDYQLVGPTTSIDVEIEQTVAGNLEKMAKHSEFNQSEITNMALKRFIASHKDFMPEEQAE